MYHKYLQVLIRIKYLIFIVSVSLFVSCNAQTNKAKYFETRIITLNDSLLINKSYAVFEELKVDLHNRDKAINLQEEIQKISVNKKLKSDDP